MNLNGTVRELVNNVFNYPTLAECNKLAALDCTHQLEQQKDHWPTRGIISSR